jgi:hypothetical protein
MIDQATKPMELFAQAAEGSKVFLRVARDAFPNGAGLLCRNCGKSRLLSHEETARCLAKGWPWCCDVRMRVEGMPQL